MEWAEEWADQVTGGLVWISILHWLTCALSDAMQISHGNNLPYSASLNHSKSRKGGNKDGVHIRGSVWGSDILQGCVWTQMCVQM